MSEIKGIQFCRNFRLNAGAMAGQADITCGYGFHETESLSAIFFHHFGVGDFHRVLSRRLAFLEGFKHAEFPGVRFIVGVSQFQAGTPDRPTAFITASPGNYRRPGIAHLNGIGRSSRFHGGLQFTFEIPGKRLNDALGLTL